MPISSRQLNGAGSTQGVFLGRQSFIRQHPNETQQVVTQVVKGLNWLSNEQNRVPQVALFLPNRVIRHLSMLRNLMV